MPEALLDEEDDLEGHPNAEVKCSGEREAEDPERLVVDLDGIPLRVSTTRGSGHSTCSYRYGVPIHQYFYEAREWLTNTMWTRMKHVIMNYPRT